MVALGTNVQRFGQGLTIDHSPARLALVPQTFRNVSFLACRCAFRRHLSAISFRRMARLTRRFLFGRRGTLALLPVPATDLQVAHTNYISQACQHYPRRTRIPSHGQAPRHHGRRGWQSARAHGTRIGELTIRAFVLRPRRHAEAQLWPPTGCWHETRLSRPRACPPPRVHIGQQSAH